MKEKTQRSLGYPHSVFYCLERLLVASEVFQGKTVLFTFNSVYLNQQLFKGFYPAICFTLGVKILGLDRK